MRAVCELMEYNEISDETMEGLDQFKPEYRNITKNVIKQVTDKINANALKLGSRMRNNFNQYLQFYVERQDDFYNAITKSGLGIDWPRFMNYLLNLKINFNESSVYTGWVDITNNNKTVLKSDANTNINTL